MYFEFSTEPTSPRLRKQLGAEQSLLWSTAPAEHAWKGPVSKSRHLQHVELLMTD